MLTFLAPFFVFSDDYWFYVYHNSNYTNLVATFFEIMSEMNSGRMINQFIDTEFIESVTDPSRFFTSNYSDYTFKTVLLID